MNEEENDLSHAENYQAFLEATEQNWLEYMKKAKFDMKAAFKAGIWHPNLSDYEDKK